ncbi:MAG: hypothetical protein R3F62_13110 [Planctomycetota bacterium]
MDPKFLLLRHFEKIVLGVFALELLYVASGLLGTPEALTRADGVEVAMTQVQSYVDDQASLEPAEGPGWRAELERELDPEAVPAARPWPTWISHRRPGIVYYVPGVDRVQARHGGPIDLTGDASQRGRIRLTWGVSPDTRHVTVRYEVYRAIDGEDAWEKLGETEALSFVDEHVSARRAYVYKVVSVAELDETDAVVRDPEVVVTLNDSERRVASDVAGPFANEREVQVIPLSTQPMTKALEITEPDFQESCSLLVRKWIDGAWEEKTFFRVSVGDPIGEPKGRLDFTTGATLRDVLEDLDPRAGLKKVKAIVIEWPDGQTETVRSDDPKLGG